MTNITILKHSNIQLSKNINSNELDCPCPKCTHTIYNPEHIKKLQELRDQLDKPITIDSAFRCPEHNKAVGGEEHSQHMLGNATDIKIHDYTPGQVQDICNPIFDGMGKYDTFTHVDSRGNHARWDLRKVKAQDVLPSGPTDEEVNTLLKDLE